MKKAILYLAANPYNTQHLPNLSGEIREVKREIRNSKYGKQFNFEAISAASAEDLLHGMMDLRPQIVHFSGHGEGRKGIILDDGSGYLNLVTNDALESFFKQFAHVECIVLNTCYSNEQAEALRSVVKYVVGISGAIEDSLAVKFASSFYNAIGNGLSIEVAFEISRSYLNLHQSSTDISLILLKREPQPSPFIDYRDYVPIRVFDPIRDLFTGVQNFITNRLGPYLARNRNYQPEMRTIFVQWIMVCIVGLALAAVVSTGPAKLLFGMFGIATALTLPLLQWQTIRYWARNISWPLWLISTIIGWSIGLLSSNVINTFSYNDLPANGFISLNEDSPPYDASDSQPDVLMLDFNRDGIFEEEIRAQWQDSTETFPSYQDRWEAKSDVEQINTWDEDGFSDRQVVFFLIRLLLGLLIGSALVGGIQGVLLQQSFLRVSITKWIWTNILGMLLGGLFGIPILLIYSEVINTRPDDLGFAIIVGLIYGAITGFVLLPQLDKQPVDISNLDGKSSDQSDHSESQTHPTSINSEMIKTQLSKLHHKMAHTGEQIERAMNEQKKRMSVKLSQQSNANADDSLKQDKEKPELPTQPPDETIDK